MDVKLLDCTLRDGGYINDWNFGHNIILTIFEKLVEAKIDNIEIGFLNNNNVFDINKTTNPSIDCYNKIFENIDKGNSKVFSMIKFGTFEVENIEPWQKNSFIDGIRVIFKKHDIKNALEYCKKIKDKGYLLSVNPVSIHTYNVEELNNLINKTNELQPNTLTIVDTCGLLDRETIGKYFSIIDKNLLNSIMLGYHSHNNFQLAFSNALDLLNTKTERPLILDGSLFGMGRCAGNACLELLAMYLNKKYDKNYNINSKIDVIDNQIVKIRQTNDWGYSMSSFVSALNDCHPYYSKFLKEKYNLQSKDVDNILKKIETQKKAVFDRTYLETLLNEN